MGGDALLDGQKALIEELIDFFHRSGRTELEQVTRQAQTLVMAAVKAATEKMATIDVETLANAAVGNLFTDAQASLDKILTPTRSAS